MTYLQNNKDKYMYMTYIEYSVILIGNSTVVDPRFSTRHTIGQFTQLQILRFEFNCKTKLYYNKLVFINSKNNIVIIT